MAGAVALAAASCDRPAPSRPSAPLADDFGAAIVVDPGRLPQRIVSLNPTTTEILFTIGAGRRLVGRSTYDVFPDGARRVADVGVPLRPNVEAVLAVHPDLVILYASNDNRGAADRLRQAGVRTIALRIDSIAQFERDTRLLGRLTGDSLRADSLVDSIASTLDRVRRATQDLPRPTVFLPTWDRPIIAIGGGSFLSQLIDIAGARNVYGDVAAPSTVVTIEDVAKRNPDVVLANPQFARFFRDDPQWRAVAAIRQHRVVSFDTSLFGRPSVTLGAAAHALANSLHPGSVP